MNRQSDLRDTISDIDRKLLELLDRRLQVAREIGEAKKEQGRAILDLEREEANLERLARDNAGSLPMESLEAIFREVMSAARETQGPRPIGYFGPPGGLCHLAVLRRFGRSAKLEGQDSSGALLESVDRGRLECALLPSREIEGLDRDLNIVKLRDGEISEEGVVVVLPAPSENTRS